MKLSLSRKPEAIAWSIEDLLEKVRAGLIRLPEFQRLFKWGPDDVLQLFDSIIRGFPIGTLLFWKGAAATNAGGRSLETAPEHLASAGSELVWVLDGQQRMTSLAGVLLSPNDPTEDRYRLAVDFDADALIKVRAADAWPQRTLPLSYTMDSVNLMTWLGARRNELSEREQRRALEVGKSIREYRVPGYIVVADDAETARLIFDRTNTTGKPLSKADVFRALHEGIGSQRPNSLEGLQQSVADLQFGSLRENLFLQAAAAVAGLDVTRMDHEALSRPELGAALPDAASALRKALSFLKMDAHIPHADLLPYGFPIVALTRFFHFHPEPRPRSRELLSRWVWRGALTQKHWTHEQKYLRETLEQVQGTDEEAEVQGWLRALPQEPIRLEPAEYSLRSAQTRLHLLAMIDLRPRDLATGAPLDAAALIADEGSAAVIPLDPRSFGEPNEDRMRASVFGRVLQKPMTQERLHSLLDNMFLDEETLASVGLDREDVHAILSDVARPFAIRRHQRLKTHVEEFFARRARWDDSDRPSLASLEVKDEP